MGKSGSDVVSQEADGQISVVIPVYNAGQSVVASIGSLQAQQWKRWRCICVDDGSRDGSGDVLDACCRRESRLTIIHQRNSGVSAARNRGLATATGKWLFFLDSDDLLTEDCLWKLHGVSVKTGANWVSCGVEIRHSDGTSRRDSRCPDDFCLERAEFLRSAGCIETSVVWGNLFDREWFMRQGLHFEAQLKVAEDSLLMTQAVCRADRIAHVSSYVGYVYHASEGGLMARSADLYAWSQMDAFRILAVSGIWRRDCVAKRYVREWLGNALNVVVTRLRRGPSEGIPRVKLPFMASLRIAWPSCRLLLKLMLLTIWEFARRFADRTSVIRDVEKLR